MSTVRKRSKEMGSDPGRIVPHYLYLLYHQHILIHVELGNSGDNPIRSIESENLHLFVKSKLVWLSG